jgi:uncharacterized protein YciI
MRSCMHERVAVWSIVLTALAGGFAYGQDATPSPSPAAQKVFAVVFRTGPAWDAAKPPAEQKFFKDHSQNIGRLKADGNLVLGGRFSDMGLVLVKASSLEDARALVDRDPSVAAGVFKADVHPWSTFHAGCLDPSR